MLSTGLPRLPAGGEQGFTLLELLVAMLVSVVIVTVVVTILLFTTNQTSLITEKVAATRAGRTTMTKIIDELHSACIASGSTGYYPVRAGSSAATLIFYNAYAKQAAESSSEGVYEHRITLNETTHKLIDTSYPSSSVSAWPVVTFSTTPTSRTLGENISPTTGTPLFEYYEYAKTASSTSSSSAAVGTLNPISITGNATLTAAQAADVAAVAVSFTASPTNKLNQQLNRSVNLSSQTTFAFTAPSSESTIEDSPCE